MRGPRSRRNGSPASDDEAALVPRRIPASRLARNGLGLRYRRRQRSGNKRQVAFSDSTFADWRELTLRDLIP